MRVALAEAGTGWLGHVCRRLGITRGDAMDSVNEDEEGLWS